MLPGGPGSGKITHCEATTKEKEFSSWVHISMTESMNQMIENTGYYWVDWGT